ncbi:MAG: amidohydrolase family protein [Steroidobacteraceae bacterium]
MRYVASLLLLWPLGCLYAPAPAHSADALALTHVTVIDGTGAAARPDQTALIRSQHIDALGASDEVAVPAGARVVDGRGKFLIPGLWDMHVHLAVPQANKEINKRLYLPLLIANGVTGVRDMYSDMPTVNAWRAEISAGTLLGPRIVGTSEILDGPGTRNYSVVRNRNDASTAVARVKAAGSDFIKVYSVLPRAGYSGIVAESKRQGLPFAGHVPVTVTVAEASDAGQRSIEHLTGMLLAVSSDEDALRKKFAPMAGADIIAARYAFERIELQGVSSYSAAKAEQLFARLVRNQTWECPTLVVLRSMAFMHDGDFSNDPRLKYMTAAARRRWSAQGDPDLDASAQAGAIDRALYPKRLELVGAMQHAGVGILAGTDMTNPYVFPGFSLHDELALLVEAGLTPMQALQTATLNPARYFGTEQQTGTVAVGKQADLVLLDADPLIDIRNTQRIAAVVVAGRLLDKPQLTNMLQMVEAVAAAR